MARCLALQWCAESSRAEISAASPGYQRETSFVNSSPTVSRLHSWLTALCVPLPCLHTASKALILSPHILSIALLSSSAPVRAHGGTRELIPCAHTCANRHLNTSKSLIHVHSGPLQHTASRPLLWFLSFYTITLHWSFYTYYTRSSPPNPTDPLIPRWVNCSSCPWPQPFVAITPDFLRGPDLIWPYQSHYTAPFCSHQRELSPFRSRDCAGEHTARDLSSSQTSYYTAQQQWALFSDSSRVR